MWTKLTAKSTFRIILVSRIVAICLWYYFDFKRIFSKIWALLLAFMKLASVAPLVLEGLSVYTPQMRDLSV